MTLDIVVFSLFLIVNFNGYDSLINDGGWWVISTSSIGFRGITLGKKERNGQFIEK